jgi:nucleotide-binding universal stress UspA family protein
MTSQVFTRILVAVDDSPAALAAVHAAVELALLGGGRIRFVHVIGDGDLVRALSRIGHEDRLDAKRDQAAASLLRHVSAAADRAGVLAETATVTGEPAGLLLAAARDWDAQIVVMGRSDVRGPGRAYVGSVTRAVLEFSEVPVLVVPRSA